MAEAAKFTRDPFMPKKIEHPRTMGVFSVFLYAVASIGLLSSGFVAFSTLAGMWPGRDLMIILVLGLVFCLIHAFTYAAIGSAAPRSGADYVLTSRVLNGPLAFASSVVFVVSSGLIAGLLVASISQVLLPTVLKVIAMVGNLPTLNDTVSGLVQPASSVMVGAIVILLAFISLVFSVRGTTRFILVTFILSLLAWGAILYQVLFPNKNFLVYWSLMIGSGSFTQQVLTAKAMGMVLAQGQNNLIAAGLFASLIVFFGYFTPVFFVSEIKRPGKNLYTGVGAALLIVGGIAIGTVFLISKLARPDWFSAISYLSMQSSEYGAMPWVILYSNLVHPSAEITWLVGLAWVLSVFTMIQVIFFYSSRIIGSWAQDNLVPANLGYLHPSTKSPIVGLLSVGIIAQVSLTAIALGGNWITIKGFVLATVLSQILPVLALILYPFLRKSDFEKASRFARFKMGPIPFVSITGVFSLIYLMAVITAGFVPGLGIDYGTAPVIGIAVLFFTAIGWYFLRRWYLLRSQQAIDTRLLDIPVEE